MKVSWCFVVLLVSFANGQDPRNFFTSTFQKARDYGGTAVNTTSSVVGSVTDILPSPSSLLNLSLNVVVGFPTAFLISALNEICSIAITTNAIQPRITPDTKKMHFLFMTKQSRYNVSLTTPGDLAEIAEFKKNATLVLFITGWNTDLSEQSDDITTMYEAFKCRSDVNFVVIDSGRFIDTLYTWSALNTESIGKDIGSALAVLFTSHGVKKIHVIGHSLGAQISGATGRRFQEVTGELIPHITGLDPARPCFNEGETLTGIFRGDAKFVDVIHTNPGIFGQKQPLGDVDFYPNGISPIPPTCFDAGCAHAMAWRLYAEASYPHNENALKAVKCNSIYSLNTNKCEKSPQATLGPLVDHAAKGNYFLRTNTKSPYGMDSDENKLSC